MHARGSSMVRRLWTFSVLGFLLVHPVAVHGCSEVMHWLNYIAGTGTGYDVASDDAGNVYAVGRASSDAFPVKDAFDPTYNGDGDAFVLVMDAEGTLEWSTYLGGDMRDEAYRVLVHDSGWLYVAGWTFGGFPVKPQGSGSISQGGPGVFVAKFGAGGDLLWSTVVNGLSGHSCVGASMDAEGNVFLATAASADVLQYHDVSYNGGGSDAAVVKVLSSGELGWVSTVGGARSDYAIDTAYAGGRLLVTGDTHSADFPNGVGGKWVARGKDAFVAEVDGEGHLVWSTVFGGSGLDTAWRVAIDVAGNAYVCGETDRQDYPIRNAQNPSFGYGSGTRGFLTKFNRVGELVWSTYVGGANNTHQDGDHPVALVADGAGGLIVAGKTSSADLPTTPGACRQHQGMWDAFVCRYTTEGRLDGCTYVGGIEYDDAYGVAHGPDATLFLTGATNSRYFCGPRELTEFDEVCWIARISAAWVGEPTATPTCVASPTPQPDLNGDGHVDTEDLLLLIDKWHVDQ